MTEAKFKNYSGEKPLTTEEKADANKTFFTTIFGPSTTEEIIVKQPWYFFWKKPVTHEVTHFGEMKYNFLFPNTSFEIVHYDDDYLEVEVLGIKYPIKQEDIGMKDCLIIIDTTNEPYVTRAGQTLSLGYHLLRFELEYCEIISENKFRCKASDIKVKVGIPQR